MGKAGADRTAEHTFSTREAASMLDLTPSEVRSFARAALVRPDREKGSEYAFGFRDLVVLRMAAALRRARVPKGRITGALADLKREAGADLAGLRLEALGSHVIVRDGEVVWRADSGQLQLPLEAPSREGSEAAPRSPASSGPPKPSGTGAGPAAVGRPTDDMEGDRAADAWLERAMAEEATDPEAAIAAYRQALSLDAGRWEAQAGLGFLLQELGRPGEAIEPYRRALAIEPEATVAFNLGVALDDLGRGDEAEEAYLRALELEPRLADAHFNLSCLYERRGDRRRALRHLIAYRDTSEG